MYLLLLSSGLGVSMDKGWRCQVNGLEESGLNVSLNIVDVFLFVITLW